MWRSERSRPNEDCIGSSCSSPAKANRASQSVTSTTRPGRKHARLLDWGSGARSQTHVRTAFAYCRGVVGDAQSTAWHKTGDITSHYCARELAELTRRPNAILKTHVSTLLRLVAQQPTKVGNGAKSRAGKKRARSATPNPLIIWRARQDLNPRPTLVRSFGLKQPTICFLICFWNACCPMFVDQRP